MTTALTTIPSALLAPLSPEMTLEEWAVEGRRLFGHSNELQWRVAVWLTDGEDRWEEALQIAEDLGISEHRRYQSKYIVKACRTLPTSVNLLALPFWHWEVVAAIPAEDREAFAHMAIKRKPTMRELRGLRNEYKALKQIAPAEQPRFENGLADGATDDGLALPPHGVTRGGDANAAGWGLHPAPVTAAADSQQESAAATTEDDPDGTSDPYADPDAAEQVEWRPCLSWECRHQIDVLRRYYREPDWSAAQVIERAISDLCGIRKARLARFDLPPSPLHLEGPLSGGVSRVGSSGVPLPLHVLTGNETAGRGNATKGMVKDRCRLRN